MSTYDTIEKTFHQFKPAFMAEAFRRRANRRGEISMTINREDRTIVFGGPQAASEVFCTEQELPLDVDILLGRFWVIMDRVAGPSTESKPE